MKPQRHIWPTRIKYTKCPYCGYIANAHETLDEQNDPNEGDISFCIKCGEVSIYDGSSPKRLIKVDVETLPWRTQSEIKKIEMAWLHTKRQREEK